MEINQDNMAVTAKHVFLSTEWDHRAAIVGVQLGPITLYVSVWRHPRSGSLRVYLPRVERGNGGYTDAVELPADLRSQLEAEAIAAYKDKAKADRVKEHEAMRSACDSAEQERNEDDSRTTRN